MRARSAGVAGEQGAGSAGTPAAPARGRVCAAFNALCAGGTPLADPLAPALRLPAVQQLFPSLRRLSLGERQKLRDVVGRLALADSRIDVFECCLTLLLASSLYDSLEAGAQHGSASLLQEIDAIHVLFCVLAAQGT